MAFAHITQTVLREARRAARAETGLPPGHLSEAIAAGLGFGTHAALIARLSAPDAVLDASAWSADGFASRLAGLSPDGPDERGRRAAAAVGSVLGSGPRSEWDRIAELVRRLHHAGGGCVSFDGDETCTLVFVDPLRGRRAGTGSATAWIDVASPVDGDEWGCPGLDGIDVGALTGEIIDKASPDRPYADRSALRYGFVPAAGLGLPRDNVPGWYNAGRWSDGTPRISIAVPPPLRCRGGVAALGLGAAAAARIERELGADPGIRLLSGAFRSNKAEFARVAAFSAADAARVPIADLSEWYCELTYHFETSNDRHPLKDRLCSEAMPRGPGGRVVLMHTLETVQDAAIAIRLAEAGAAVWVSVHGETEREAAKAASRLGLDPGACRLHIHV